MGKKKNMRTEPVSHLRGRVPGLRKPTTRNERRRRLRHHVRRRHRHRHGLRRVVVVLWLRRVVVWMLVVVVVVVVAARGCLGPGGFILGGIYGVGPQKQNFFNWFFLPNIKTRHPPGRPVAVCAWADARDVGDARVRARMMMMVHVLRRRKGVDNNLPGLGPGPRARVRAAVPAAVVRRVAAVRVVVLPGLSVARGVPTPLAGFRL
jgi:hypothetical protein